MAFLPMAEMAEGIDDNHSDVIIEKSTFNDMLEPVAAGIILLEQFFNNGGLRAEE